MMHTADMSGESRSSLSIQETPRHGEDPRQNCPMQSEFRRTMSDPMWSVSPEGRQWLLIAPDRMKHPAPVWRRNLQVSDLGMFIPCWVVSIPGSKQGIPWIKSKLNRPLSTLSTWKLVNAAYSAFLCFSTVLRGFECVL